MIPASLTAVRWLIQPFSQDLPEPLYLHVFEDGEAEAEMDFLADRTRALRFVSEAAARCFALAHRLVGVCVVGHRPGDLVAPAIPPFDRVAAVA